MVVNPNLPIPNLHSPYDPEEEDDKEEEDTPEIIINAATQIRGNGNIISIAQIDSVRIASFLTAILNGQQPTDVASPREGSSSTPATREIMTKQFPKMNITVNCGATIIGDRNIVGPGLGDVARQMRNQAVPTQRQGQNQAQPSTSADISSPTLSQSSTVPGEVPSGVKRRTDSDAGESIAKKQR